MIVELPSQISPLPVMEVALRHLSGRSLLLGVETLGGCWNLTTSLVIGETEQGHAGGPVLHNVLCQSILDTNTAAPIAAEVYCARPTSKRGVSPRPCAMSHLQRPPASQRAAGFTIC